MLYYNYNYNYYNHSHTYNFSGIYIHKIFMNSNNAFYKDFFYDIVFFRNNCI